MASLWSLLTILLVAAVYKMDAVHSVEIGKNTQCEKMMVNKDTTVIINGVGISPAGDCMFTFEATDADNCAGLCYQLNPYALFNDSKVSLELTLGTESQKYQNTRVTNSVPVCSETETTMTAKLMTGSDYVYNQKYPGYVFTLEVYHKCSPRGQIVNIPFQTAIEHADGYHDREEFEEKVRSNYLTGILLGFGLACIFLVVLLAGWCYTKNSPNRGPNRSVGMPKVGGFKKKLNMNKESKESKSKPEMGVSYHSSKNDEEKALLVTGAATAGAVVVKVEDDHDEEDHHNDSPKSHDSPKCDNNDVGGDSGGANCGGGGGSDD